MVRRSVASTILGVMATRNLSASWSAPATDYAQGRRKWTRLGVITGGARGQGGGTRNLEVDITPQSRIPDQVRESGTVRNE